MILAAAFDFQTAQFWIDVGSVALTIILAIPTILPKKRRKRLSYRVLSDAALIDDRKDLGEEDIQININGNEVTNARLIMMQLMNTGSQPIKKDEYEYDDESKIRIEFNPLLSEQSPDAKPVTQPLPQKQLVPSKPLLQVTQTLQQPQSPLIICALHATKPDGIMSKDQQKKQLRLGRLPTSDSPLYDYVDLMGTLMNPGDYMNLKFLTQGRVDITLHGRLVGGSVEPYAPPPQLITPWRIALIVILAVAVATFNLGLGLIEGFVQNNCALSLSTVADGGSTAFYSTAQLEANKYHSTCLVGSIAVTSSSSGAGLRSLEDGHLQVANTELSLKEAGYPYTDLQEHQVAVIIFTIIVNKHLSGITSLRRDQITDIYNGTITNWHSIGGPDLAIKVIGRPSDSGTHAAFTRFVLDQPEKAVSRVESSTQGVIDDVSSDSGAIGYVDLGSANQASTAVNALEIDGNSPTVGLVERDSYRFWAIERMYTKQNADTLSLSFINYTTRDIQTNGTFIRIGDMPRSVLEAHA
jgi:phosphate transport system substrate-binding protein